MQQFKNLIFLNDVGIFKENKCWAVIFHRNFEKSTKNIKRIIVNNFWRSRNLFDKK